MRGTAVKCEEKPLLGGRYVKFTQGFSGLSSKISDKNRKRKPNKNKVGMEWETQ